MFNLMANVKSLATIEGLCLSLVEQFPWIWSLFAVIVGGLVLLTAGIFSDKPWRLWVGFILSGIGLGAFAILSVIL